MKKLFLFALLGFCAMTTTTSCSSDDDNTQQEAKNFFSVENNEYSLKTGLLEFWGEDAPGTFAWDVNLLSSNLSINFENDFPFEFEDDLVSNILMELNTDTMDGLLAGVYEIDQENFSPFVCSYIELAVECDVSDFDADEEIACTGFYFIESNGTVEIVSIEGDVYEFKIEGETEEGFAFEAHYKGELLDLDNFMERPYTEIEFNKKFNRKPRKK
ncbi:MAG: hypothetical protein R6V37_01470 [Psychroflexus maritimus]